jgi:hypothetical protein
VLPKIEAIAATSGGTVCAQFVRCGKAGCRCSRGALHGPYHYLFWREGRTLKKLYVRSADVADVRDLCEKRRELAASAREMTRLAGSDDLLDRMLKKMVKWW